MKRDSLPQYLALKSSYPIEGINALTPHVMHWSDSVWLMDLRPCHSYWRNQATHIQKEPLMLWAEILAQMMPDEGQCYHAAAADHPWRALLMAEHMHSRQLFGLIEERSPFGQALFRQLSWDSWFACAQQVIPLLNTTKSKKSSFLRPVPRMRSSMASLGVKVPWDLHQGSASAIQKRFGYGLALLWEWTFPKGELQHRLHEADFPWKIWQPPQPPHITRHLDHPLREWEHLGPWLQQDLEILRQKSCWNARNEHILRMDWELNCDFYQILVPICFRYPHDLEREAEHHRTTLLQAQYAFHAVMNNINPRATDTMGPAIHIKTGSHNLVLEKNDVMVTGWCLTITERVARPHTLRTLFPDAAEDPSLDQLMSLANQLPVALQRYELLEHWLPEHSFCQTKEHDGRDVQAPWLSAAIHRPLCIYSKPLECATPFAQNTHFIERVSTDWWHTQDASMFFRDYYRHHDAKGGVQWLFRDSSGQWFCHGLFN